MKKEIKTDRVAIRNPVDFVRKIRNNNEKWILQKKLVQHYNFLTQQFITELDVNQVGAAVES
jgi:hypothetical protein